MKERKEEYFARMEKAYGVFSEMTELRLKLKALDEKFHALCDEPENGKESATSRTLEKWGKELKIKNGNHKR